MPNNITTNKVQLSWDREAFLSRFSVITYCRDDHKECLSYEQLVENVSNVISVVGIRARWQDGFYTRFFILTEKTDSEEVLRALRCISNLRSSYAVLMQYPLELRERIIASLALNSLGMVANSNSAMCSGGSLILCDSRNFLCRSGKEVVCLEVGINGYMVLYAKTITFAHPRDLRELKNYHKQLFSISNIVHGDWWSGRAVVPISLKKAQGAQPEDLYIQKKLSSKHNQVSYWPYDPHNYTRGRLFVICQRLESVNIRYKGILQLSFSEYEPLLYDEYKKKESQEVLNSIFKTFQLGSMYIEDRFGTPESLSCVSDIRKSMAEALEGEPNWANIPESASYILKLCTAEEENESARTEYVRSLDRLRYDDRVLQHITIDSDDGFSAVKARRVLLELFVKDCLVKGVIPNMLSKPLSGWEFLRYKILDGFVVGSSLIVKEGGSLCFSDFGFSGESPALDFESFARERLLFTDVDKIKGSRDYLVMRKGETVLMIIDTDEIPILDVAKIDEGYGRVLNNGEPLSIFKRKKDKYQYLGGYLGFNLWRTDGLSGEQNGAYSYVCGYNSEGIQFGSAAHPLKMDRMPRVRRLFVLHKGGEDNVDEIVSGEVAGMLKSVFGRWGELMTYPYPFKFLAEHLDSLSETAFSTHWGQLKKTSVLF